MWSALAEYLDSDEVPREGREPKITRDQRCVKRFAQGDVYPVVRRQVVPQFPYAWAKVMVRMSDDRQRRQIGQSFKCPGFVEFAEEGISSKDVRDFNVQQMRRMKVLVSVAESSRDVRRTGCAENKGDDRRRIQHGQGRSRSSRIASAGDSEVDTGFRAANLSSISSTVGNSAIR